MHQFDFFPAINDAVNIVSPIRCAPLWLTVEALNSWQLKRGIWVLRRLFSQIKSRKG